MKRALLKDLRKHLKMSSNKDYHKEMEDTVRLISLMLKQKNYRKVRDFTKHLLNVLDTDKMSKKVEKLILVQNEKKG